MPPVDLLVRTSGEMRLSNYMLWQLAYAEIIFTPTYWPDYDEECLVRGFRRIRKKNAQVWRIIVMETNEIKPKTKRTSTIKISLNEISEATKKSMGRPAQLLRLFLGVIAVPALLLGGWYFLALVFFVSIIAVLEIMRGTKISKR